MLFDGSEQNIAKATSFYSSRRDGLKYSRPTLVHAWITAENINDLIRSNGFEGEIDLLSLDMDGIDYWVWNAIECVRPRVVVVEYNQKLGATRAVTVPNKPDFVMDWNHSHFVGASLPAFVKLGLKKGYRLIGSESFGINAFFVRNDIAASLLPEVVMSKCTVHPSPESVWWGKYPFAEV